jgi:DNA-binding PadR family transcriptional regulator
MKKATAYSILKRLNQSGYVGVTVEQDCNRPPRQIYAITPSGERRFGELLRSTLASVDIVTPSGDIGFMFIDHLSQDEAVQLLEERLGKVEAHLRMLTALPQHGRGSGVDLSIRHRLALLNCDKEWLTNTIAEVRSER